MFHVKLNIFIHGNTTEINTAMTKNTININANIPTLMQPTPTHYELCFLHMAHACPYDRQSSHAKSDLRMDTTSPYEGHISHPFFS